MLLDVDDTPLAFVDAGSFVADCLSEMRFPERISVSKAANRHRLLQNPGGYSGRWEDSPHDMSMLDRFMDGLNADSPYDEVIVIGPAQTGKSEIGNNWQLHTILYDPADTLFISPTKELTNSYVTTQFNKMLDLAPELRDRQLSGPSADNINLKQFRGCDFHFLWPAGSSFRARPFPRARLDDYDEIPTDIDGQGDALGLAKGRDASFVAFGETKIYVNSTPKLGPRAGTEALVAQGTDERLYVDCLMCGQPFALYSDRLSYDREGTAEDAAASAGVICPHAGCGGVHLPSDKRALLQTKRWVGNGEEAVSLSVDPAGKTGQLVPSRRLSGRLDGLFGMRPWSNMASLARTAEIKFAIEQDDAGLKTFDQTVAGRNFERSNWPHLFDQDEESISEDELLARAKASPYCLGEVAPGGRVLVAAVDQQANRFEVAVWAFGVGFRSWLVDRFNVLVIEENGRARSLRPFTRPGDWSVLHEKVLSLTYPLAGAPHLRMKIFNTIVDTGGLDNATDNAFAWWHSMVSGDIGSGRPALPPTAITLYKGGNKPDKPLLPSPTIDARRQIKGAPQAELYIPNANRIKNILDVRLKTRDGGQGTISLPRDIDPAHVAEFKAEYKSGEAWVREEHRANETLDLYVMAYSVILRFGGLDSTLAWVPEWARPPKGAPDKAPPMPESLTLAESTDAPPPSPPPAPRAPRKIAVRRNRGVRSVRAQ